MAKKFIPLEEPHTSKGGQSVIYRAIYEFNGHKVRLTIKSDSYANQSYARMDIFNPTDLKWNRLHYLHYADMHTETGLCYRPNNQGLDLSHFEVDAGTLKMMTRNLIG